MLLAEESRIAKSVQLLLSLAHEGVQPSLHIWKLFPNVVHQYLPVSLVCDTKRTADGIERLSQELGTAAVSDVAVDCVILEKVFFLLPSVLHRHVRDDILLTSVNDTDEAKFERVSTASKDIEGIGSGVHQVKLGEDTESSQSPRIDRASEFERVRVGEIDICRRDSKNDTGCQGNASGCTHELGLDM